MSSALGKISGDTKQSGQSVVEVALVLPLLLLLSLGVIEFGRYVYIGIIVGNAAHAGAIYGARSVLNLATSSTGIRQAAANDFQANGQNPSTLNVTWTAGCGCDNGGTVTAGVCVPGTGSAPPTCPSGQTWVIDLSVTAQGTFNALFSYPGIPGSIHISKTSTMRVMSN